MNNEQLADEARLLLDNQVFTQALGDIERNAIEALKRSPAGANGTRQELIVTLRVVESLKDNIQDRINTLLIEAD